MQRATRGCLSSSRHHVLGPLLGVSLACASHALTEMITARVESSDFSSHAAAAFLGRPKKHQPPGPPPPQRTATRGSGSAPEANFPAGRPNSREITSQIITVLSVPILASMDQGIRPLEGHTDSVAIKSLILWHLSRRDGASGTRGPQPSAVWCGACPGLQGDRV